MAFTFRGTYTQNNGDAPAAGTVAIKNRSSGATLDTATLDAGGSYELVLDEQEGEMRVVETITGVPVRTYEVGVSKGSVTDTSRDIGYTGPAQSGASVAPVWAHFAIASSGPTFGPATIVPIVITGLTEGEPVGLVDFFLSGGPFTLGAGGWVKLLSGLAVIPDGATLALADYSTEICVTNLAGTEKLAVACGVVPLDEGGTDPIAFVAASEDEQIGTDLTVDGSGRIASTAGGQFLVQVVGQVSYTPAP